MDAELQQSWERHLRKARESSCRLILIVGEEGTGKTTLLQALSDAFHIPRINVGEDLSRKLLTVEVEDRARRTDETLAELINDAGSDSVALDNTEILFQPELALKPLEALKAAARTRLIIATWNGKVADGCISFGWPAHPAHRIYTLKDHPEITVNPQ